MKRAGVKHGFSKRGNRGGSKFGSMNVKSDSGTPDDPQRVADNRQKILKRANLNPEKLVFLRTLSHGNTVFQAHVRDGGHEIDGYDAITTNDPITIGLSVADCVPILLFDRQTNAVAAVHAGWRSTQANVVIETVKEMQRHFGSDPIDLIAVLGPSICGKCFEVGEEVAELFAEGHRSKRGRRLCVDLRSANRLQLKMSGVEKIDDIDICTFENTRDFFSARKEGQTGRFLAFISPKLK
ncbi:MAG: peptidoglycan editing factor PgeF [Candidatus Saccharimonadales bacterium]|nr:peptidoglycan editing factor PgeF [Candidatus Saccharimonadales bacterium]